MIKKTVKFLKEVRQEMKYVSWPTKDDLKEGTWVVIAMSAIVAIFLSLVDMGFGFLMKFVLFKG